MSKAFTSEETDEGPVLIPPRAPLPDGVINYVTPEGLAALLAELESLKQRRARLAAEKAEQKRDLQLVNGQISQLESRLATAAVVDQMSQPRDQVRFGATVIVEGESGERRNYQLVGVDEADARQHKIAFVAPLARALLGKRVGDTVTVTTPRAEEELTVIAIDYLPLT